MFLLMVPKTLNLPFKCSKDKAFLQPMFSARIKNMVFYQTKKLEEQKQKERLCRTISLSGFVLLTEENAAKIMCMKNRQELLKFNTSFYDPPANT